MLPGAIKHFLQGLVAISMRRPNYFCTEEIIKEQIPRSGFGGIPSQDQGAIQTEASRRRSSLAAVVRLYSAGSDQGASPIG
jgi:hypothetical protein